MKVRFNREEMAEGLGAICSVIAQRTPKPILQCVLIEVRSDAILLSATDMEISARFAATQVEVSKAGSAVAVADTFSRIVRECTDELLSLELKGNLLHIRGAGSHFQVVTQSAEEFPPIPVLEGEPDFRVEASVFRKLIDWTSFAAARESTRYAINGVLCEIDGLKITMVGTDGRRLALGRGAASWSASEGLRTAIVPVKAATLLSRLPIDGTASMAVAVRPNQLLVSAGASSLSTALVEGHFPPYRDVVPQDNDKFVELPTAEFQGALRRANLLTSEESRSVRLSLSSEQLTLTSRAPEAGEASITLSIQYRGEPMDIGFNPVFLLDLLRVVDTEQITLSLKDGNRPGVIAMGPDFLHVVMPVSLSAV